MTPDTLINDIPLDLAIRAHNGTSQVPEDRGEQERAGYAQQLAADYTALSQLATTDEKRATLQAEFARYRAGYRQRFTDLLHAKSRCLSWLVSGPANFPTRRAEKANRSSSNKLTELIEYRQRALKAIRRALQPELAPIMSGDSDAVARLKAKMSGLEADRDRMKAVNAAIRKHKKGGFDAQLQALIDLGVHESQARKILEPNYMGRVGIESWQLSNIGAEIRRLKLRLAKVEADQAAPSVEADGENGIRFEDAPADNRVRLFFLGKPDADVRTDLKRHGFRWAPSLGCWQAYRNFRSVECAKRVAGVRS